MPAPTIVEMPKQDTVEAALRRALDNCADCDEVVIVMQRKDGGLSWEGRNECKLSILLFIVQSWVWQMHAIAFGNPVPPPAPPPEGV